jgi:peroxidase
MPIDFASTFADLARVANREPDGSGNNRAHEGWGQAHTELRRVTSPSYDGPDGVYAEGAMPLPIAPAGSFPPQPVGELPRPRDISDKILAQDPGDDRPNSYGFNEFGQFFGQFLAHDLAESEPSVGDPPAGDVLFLDGLPFPFVRTPGHDENGTGVRQQENEETSFLDLSTVYGTSEEMLELLRAENSAELHTGDGNLLPMFQEIANHHGEDVARVLQVLVPNSSPDTNTELYAAGDNRVNENTALLTHHTMWMRNHNWHVDRLQAEFPDWSNEQLFEAARALNEAEWQNVVYNEYLPEIIGAGSLREYEGYDRSVDPAILSEWTTAAFRFGHDQSNNELDTLTEQGKGTGTFTLSQAFALANAAQAIRTNDAMDEWVRGQLAAHTQEIDGKVVEGNRNALFGRDQIIDLTVFDIQRGRDHGVGNYNNLRDGLDFPTYRSFDHFARRNDLDTDTLSALEEVYGADGIDKLDSFVGGLLEKKAGGSQLGETFTKLTVMQFEALRDGDRFYFENRFEDDPDLIQSVEDVTLADVIERTTGIDHAYHEGFAAHERIGGTAGRDTALEGTPGDDLMMGYGGHDRIAGHRGEDDLYGGRGNDQLRGGNGNDLINGEQGTDRLWGGNGNDIHVFEKGSGRDTVVDFDRSADRIDLSDYEFASLRQVREAAEDSQRGVTISLDEATGDRVHLAGDFEADQLRANDFIFSDFAAIA